jgi:hypothetical protein
VDNDRLGVAVAKRLAIVVVTPCPPRLLEMTTGAWNDDNDWKC